MKKRLRKKLRTGEFQEFGFEVRFRLRPELSEQELDAFLDAFLEEAIEARHLGFGGGGREEWSGYVATMGRGTATHEDRAAVDRWLASRSEVVEISALPGALIHNSRLTRCVGRDHALGMILRAKKISGPEALLATMGTPDQQT